MSLLLCTGPSAKAQVRYDVWTADSGLPQNIVRGIEQTPDGYLWIATLDGVARFDGVRFTIFNKSDTPGIRSNRFGSMVQGRGGDLWFVTESGSITRYHDRLFLDYGAAQGIPDHDVHGITTDDAGEVWILLHDSIAHWNETAKRFVDSTPAGRRLPYKELRWGNAGFWGSDGKYLHCFVKGRFHDFSLGPWLHGRDIWEAAIAQNGTVWIETKKGTHLRITGGSLKTEPTEGSTSYVDRRGHVWEMHVGHQLYRTMESAGAVSTILISQVYEDREGSLWLGTEGQGLDRVRTESIHTYSKEQGLVGRNVYPIYQDRSGAVWVGAWNGGLSRFAHGKFTSYTIANGLLNPLVSALFEDRDGRLWIGTHGGLNVLENGKSRRNIGPTLPPDDLVQAIFQDKEQTLWFGTAHGLFSYKDGNTKVFTTQNGLATDDVRVIIESPTGDLWIGGYGGLSNFHAGQFRHWTERDALPSDNIRSLYEDREGVLWIGSYDGGLGRFKDGKVTRYTVRDGLFNNGVFQILEDVHANLWMSSNRGIYRVSKQELSDFSAGKRKMFTSASYGKGDGMLNVECNGGLWPAGVKTRDGKMWFPTQEGVAIVDPEAVPVNIQAPPVVIESSSLDNIVSPVAATLRVPPGKENLEINYTALSFLQSNRIQFRYKMSGLDESWVDAGTRRTAYYSYIPPGHYQFQVIAGNSDGVWNEVGSSLPVVVLAPFYRTWWFLTLLACTVASLMWAIADYRIRQVKKAQATRQAFSQQLISSQERERKRIAAELHDSLGQRLIVINNLALFSLRARRSAAASAAELEAIEEINTEAALAIEETRSISYNLRPFQLDRLGLSKSVEALLRSVSKSSSIRITSEIANVDELFPEELRINFYRIVQEALTNVMKHAAATEVEVHVSRQPTRVMLSIRDNGRGYVQGLRTASPHTGGFGLAGVEERAGLLGGTLRMRSDPGRGTLMTVEIPVSGGDHG